VGLLQPHHHRSRCAWRKERTKQSQPKKQEKKKQTTNKAMTSRSATGEGDIQLITVEGRTYRKARLKSQIAPKKFKAAEEESIVDNDDEEIEKEEGGNTFFIKLNIAPVFYKFIIGKKSATLTRIQQGLSGFGLFHFV
jgi:hypothetical protein